MPRSFLVKSGRADDLRTSYQKLREKYAQTASTRVQPLAPYTPVKQQDATQSHLSAERPTLPHVINSEGTNATTIEEAQDVVDAADNVKSKSPDVTMQPRGLSPTTFNPCNYPLKKRPRRYFEETNLNQDSVEVKSKKARNYYINETTESFNYSEQKRNLLCGDSIQSESDRTLCDDWYPGCRGSLGDYRPEYLNALTLSPDHLNSQLMYFSQLRKVLQQPGSFLQSGLSPNSNKQITPTDLYSSSKFQNFMFDSNQNVIPKTLLTDQSDNVSQLRRRNTVDYTIDTFLNSDGRSKVKNNPISPLRNDETVTDRQRYTCTECGKNYATSSNLSRHKQTHRSLESKLAKKCPHCDKVYVSMPALSMHILTHELRHTCHVCNKGFSRPWLLQGHLRSHTGERPYGCAHCGKAFADRSNLRAHMQTHSSLKNYKCQRCEKTFALKSYLNKHYDSSCLKDEADIDMEVSTTVVKNETEERIDLTRPSTVYVTEA